MNSARAERLFASDGRTVIVALDHALGSGQVEPLDRPAALLERILAGEPDGLILSRGMLKLVPPKYAGRRWLTADYYATSVLPGEEGGLELQECLWDAFDARAAGADGLKALLVFGRSDPELHCRNLRYLARLIAGAQEAELGVMIEAVLWGPQIPDDRRAEARWVANAARVAFELGADVIKIPMPDDAGALERLAGAIPVPLVLMGGPAGDPMRLFEALRVALDAGVRGVALGRNVWQHPDPTAITRALSALVHQNATPREAFDIVRAPTVGGLT